MTVSSIVRSVTKKVAPQLPDQTFANCGAKGTSIKAANEVAKQAQEAQNENSVIYAIRNLPVKEVIEKFKKDTSLLEFRDPVGATPVLLACLFQKKDLIKAIITEFPHTILDSYQGPCGAYTGENMLHILLSNSDAETIRWIHTFLKHRQGHPHNLDDWATLLTQRAEGSFFQPFGPLMYENSKSRTQKCYFGELPLSHAVASNRIDLVEFLVETGANMVAQDVVGNTCLHIAVIKRQNDMCKALIMLSKKKPETAHLMDIQNMHKLNPLLLAFKLQHSMEADTISEFMKNTIWKWGPITCSNTPLLHFDPLMRRLFVKDYAKMIGQPTGLDIAAATENFIFDNPVMERIIWCKWELFARTKFIKFACEIFAVAVCVSMTVALRQNDTDEDACMKRSLLKHIVTEATPREVGVFIMEVLTIMWTFFHSWRLFREIKTYGIRNSFLDTTSYIAYDNTMASLLVVVNAIQWLFRFLCMYTAYTYSLVCVVGIIWIYAILQLLAFRSLGKFVIMILEMTRKDLSKWTGFVLIIMAMFVSFFMIIFQNEPGMDLDSLAIFLNVVIVTIYGGYEPIYDDFQNPWNHFLYTSLSILFGLICNIMLLNLLIAMFGETYMAVEEMAESKWRHMFIQMILSIERELTDGEVEELKAKPNRYFMFNSGDDPSGWQLTAHEPYLSTEVMDQEWKHQNGAHELLEDFFVRAKQEKFRTTAYSVVDVLHAESIIKKNVETFRKRRSSVVPKAASPTASPASPPTIVIKNAASNQETMAPVIPSSMSLAQPDDVL